MSKDSWYNKLKKRLFGAPSTLQELTQLLHEAQVNQLIDPDTLRMIEGALQVSDMCVNEIMVPRSEMVVIHKDTEIHEILPLAIKSGHSRFPIIGENKDEIIGILLAKDLLAHCLPDKPERSFIKDILRPAVFIPESKRLGNLLNEFRRSRNHIALVVDEYGGVSGLVTIEDVLEQIVGDIEDEHDVNEDIYIKKHKDNYYSIKAITPIEEFNRFFNTQLSDEEFDTIGGLVLQGFGHLPKRGESIIIEGITFKVSRANNRRIQVLQTTLIPSQGKDNG